MGTTLEGGDGGELHAAGGGGEGKCRWSKMRRSGEDLEVFSYSRVGSYRSL